MSEQKQNIQKQETNQKSHKVRNLICLALACVLLIGGTMAYFTDYATTQANGTAGTVAIAVDSHINLLNEDGMDILNPGDLRDAGFDVTNMGNKSVDVRETIALSAYDRDGNPMNFTGDADTQSEFDLYLRSDVEEIVGEGWKPKADAKPLEVKSIDGNTITYVRPEYSLNGNSDEYDEVETVDGVDTFKKENDFVLIFKGETGNAWQGASLKVDVIVEAKQHENTGAGWDIVTKEEVTVGEITKDVVDPEIVITPLEKVEDEPVLPEAPEAVDDIFITFFYPFAGEDEEDLFTGEMDIAIISSDTGEVVFAGVVDTGEEGILALSSANIPAGEYEIGFRDHRVSYKPSFPLMIPGPGSYEVELWFT